MLAALLLAQVETSTAIDVAFPAEGAQTLRWYGWKTIAVDGAFAATLFGSLAALAATHSSDAWLAPIAAPYVVGVPMTHVFHDNLLAAILSGVLRLIVPAGAYLVPRFTCEERFCEDSTVARVVMLSGLVTTVVLIPILDAALFSWEEIIAEGSAPTE